MNIMHEVNDPKCDISKSEFCKTAPDFLFILGFLKDNVHKYNSYTSRTTNVYTRKVTDSSHSRHIEYV